MWQTRGRDARTGNPLQLTWGHDMGIRPSLLVFPGPLFSFTLSSGLAIPSSDQ